MPVTGPIAVVVILVVALRVRGFAAGVGRSAKVLKDKSVLPVDSCRGFRCI